MSVEISGSAASQALLRLGLGLGRDDLDLLLVERVVERVDLRRVEVELVEGEGDLVCVEAPLRPS